VVLVGAGPGDAGLLTLHALQAMQAADVVLYDALVSPEIPRTWSAKMPIKSAWANAPVLHQVQQEETNRLLVHYAQQGKRVVRLKGGDPFVFGRGGEEAQVLAASRVFRFASCPASPLHWAPPPMPAFRSPTAIMRPNCALHYRPLPPRRPRFALANAGARQPDTGDLYGHHQSRPKSPRSLIAHGRSRATPPWR
jgi:hypothetical protein